MVRTIPSAKSGMNLRKKTMMKNRLHHESEETIEEPIHPGQQRRIQQGQEVFSEDYFSSARVDQHTGWQYWPSSPSSSCWYASEWSWKWAHKFFICSNLSFLSQLVSFTVGRSTVTDVGCGQDSLTSYFLMHFTRVYTTLWLKMSHDVSFLKYVHPHVIACLSVCCFLVLSSSSVSRASTFSLTSTCSLS